MQSARHAAAASVNTLQVLTHFEIGRRIVEHEQKGAKRAAYGAELLKELSARLTEEFWKGFSKSNLALMRGFFAVWKDRMPIFQKPSGKLIETGKAQKASGKFVAEPLVPKPVSEFRSLFPLSWSHYVLLLTIEDPDERSSYEIEAASEGWSIPELKRQVGSCLYERLALSR